MNNCSNNLFANITSQDKECNHGVLKNLKKLRVVVKASSTNTQINEINSWFYTLKCFFMLFRPISCFHLFLSPSSWARWPQLWSTSPYGGTHALWHHGLLGQFIQVKVVFTLSLRGKIATVYLQFWRHYFEEWWLQNQIIIRWETIYYVTNWASWMVGSI